MYGHVIKHNKAQSRSTIQNLENRFANQGSDISPLLGYGETVMPTAADIVAQRWAVWGNVSTSILDGEIGADISGHQLRQHFGFDYALNNNVIVGLSFDLNPNASDAMSAKGDRVTVSASLELAHTLISAAGFGKAYLRASVEYVDTNGDDSSAALSTDYHSESVSGSFAAGLQYNMVNGFNVSAEVKSGGLGSDIADYGANLRLGYSF